MPPARLPPSIGGVRARPRTRQPNPASAEVRVLAIGALYRGLALSVGKTFRRRIELDDLANARILILKPCCLGDVVFATPFLRELRRQLPKAHLTFGVSTHARPAILGSPHLNALLDTGAVGAGRYRLREYLRLIQQVRAGHFTACFVLERSALLASLPGLAGIPIRVGIDSGVRGFSLSVGIPAKPSRPESELYLDLLRAVGGEPRSGELEYFPSPAAVEQIDRLVGERLRGERFVVLHAAGGVNPGMALLRKRWPIESFAALAGRLQESGVVPVMVGAPEDHRAVNAIIHALGARRANSELLDLTGELTLDALAELARRALAYVGNDSGPTHLAEAAGAQVIALFGPSDPVVYGPRSRHAIAVTAGLWCSPCFESGRVAPCVDPVCMPAISVETVWRQLAPWLVEREQSE